jgi:hypothetical protein
MVSALGGRMAEDGGGGVRRSLGCPEATKINCATPRKMTRAILIGRRSGHICLHVKNGFKKKMKNRLVIRCPFLTGF